MSHKKNHRLHETRTHTITALLTFLTSNKPTHTIFSLIARRDELLHEPTRTCFLMYIFGISWPTARKFFREILCLMKAFSRKVSVSIGENNRHVFVWQQRITGCSNTSLKWFYRPPCVFSKGEAHLCLEPGLLSSVLSAHARRWLWRLHFRLLLRKQFQLLGQTQSVTVQQQTDNL